MCAKLNYTTATFKSVLHLAHTIVPTIQPKLAKKLYYAVQKFYISNPKEHRSLLLTGIDEAQKVVDSLLNWKSSDIELIPLYGALMPFCTRDLQQLSAKKGPFVSIMNSLSNYK